VTVALLLLAVPVAQAKLPAPAPQAPAAGATAEALPALTWKAVTKADHYEVQLAADDRFASPVSVFGSKATLATRNTAATPDKSASDGTYFWRVRAVSAANATGRWSKARELVKAWETAPLLQGGNGLAVTWPSVPLVLRWSLVPHAQRYLITIATDDSLSNVVLGTAAKPQDTIGNVFALPSTLAPGDYAWAVTPQDSDGYRGQRSAVGHFHWSWPTSTQVRVADLDPDPRVFDPQFSWDAVAGAASYEVEVNAAEDFAPGSKWCCSDKTIGTSLSPKSVLANNAYYVRVRAFDPEGNAGAWNYYNANSAFTKAFDDVTPTIPNLRLVDTDGNTVGGAPSTDTPIVAWDPVPGASRYEVNWGVYKPDGGGTPFCHFNDPANDSDTEVTGSTAWTPLSSNQHIGPDAWPGPQTNSRQLIATHQYCVRVLARTDDDAKGQQVVSQFTTLNGSGNPAFTFAAQPAAATPGPPLPSTYKLPADGSSTPRTPLFTWSRVTDAAGYYVVVSRDAGFTRIADIGYTRVPAYSPRLRHANTVTSPLSDETTAYYWAVIPTTNVGSAVNDNPQDMSPRTFNKASIPPALLSPVGDSDVTAQPTFRWSEAENAREYRLQVSQDPTFGSPIDDVLTDSTAFTSSSTYPADTQLFWRVRANDWNDQGLNWSTAGTFRRRLVAPSAASDNQLTGELIPSLAWGPVEGATSYSVHVDQGNGKPKDFTVASPVFTPTSVFGTGIWHWQARSNFPTSSGGEVSSGYFPAISFTRTLGPVKGVNALKSGRRVLITWDPDPAAKSYRAEIAKTDAFGGTSESTRTVNTGWAPKLSSSAALAGGRLFWRVAPVDDGGSTGAYATGSFVLPRGMRVRASGLLKRGRRGRLSITVTDRAGKPVRKAQVTITGAGMRTRRVRTNKRGTAAIAVTPRRRGLVTVSARLKGYADGTGTARVR
jgi:hypothetical protein